MSDPEWEAKQTLAFWLRKYLQAENAKAEGQTEEIDYLLYSSSKCMSHIHGFLSGVGCYAPSRVRKELHAIWDKFYAVMQLRFHARIEGRK